MIFNEQYYIKQIKLRDSNQDMSNKRNELVKNQISADIEISRNSITIAEENKKMEEWNKIKPPMFSKDWNNKRKELKKAKKEVKEAQKRISVAKKKIDNLANKIQVVNESQIDQQVLYKTNIPACMSYYNDCLIIKDQPIPEDREEDSKKEVIVHSSNCYPFDYQSLEDFDENKPSKYVIIEEYSQTKDETFNLSSEAIILVEEKEFNTIPKEDLNRYNFIKYSGEFRNCFYNFLKILNLKIHNKNN